MSRLLAVNVALWLSTLSTAPALAKMEEPHPCWAFRSLIATNDRLACAVMDKFVSDDPNDSSREIHDFRMFEFQTLHRM